jgi:hypothetical protein
MGFVGLLGKDKLEDQMFNKDIKYRCFSVGEGDGR